MWTPSMLNVVHVAYLHVFGPLDLCFNSVVGPCISSSHHALHNFEIVLYFVLFGLVIRSYALLQVPKRRGSGYETNQFSKEGKK